MNDLVVFNNTRKKAGLFSVKLTLDIAGKVKNVYHINVKTEYFSPELNMYKIITDQEEQIYYATDIIIKAQITKQ